MKNRLLLLRRRDEVFFPGHIILVIFLQLTAEEEVEVFAIGQRLVVF
jgi:hypothetical protein